MKEWDGLIERRGQLLVKKGRHGEQSLGFGMETNQGANSSSLTC